MVQSCLLAAWQLWQDSREFVDCLNEDGLVLPRAAKKSGNIEGQAELNKQRRLISAASHDRLRALAGKAVDTLEAALDSGDSRIAVEVMKAVGLYGQVKPPGGPADAELAMWEKAKEWAALEIMRKGPSLDPLLDILVHDKEVARLTRQRMEELTESQADKSRNKAE